MTDDAHLRLAPGGTAPAAPIAPANGPDPRGGGTPAFRRLLESLERLAQQHRQPPAVGDADQLQAALQRADHDFATAMDLRRRLEEAFRGRQ
jgi:hypothetical protein